MDAAARARPRRDRPLIPPNYVSLRDLQELRLREKEERRRRQEEEEAAAARRAEEEEERRRKAEEEAAAERRAKEEEERLLRQVEEAAARRVRDAAAAVAPRPEMKGSSSSRAPFRYNERNRGGPRVVVGPHRPPPPPRGEGSAVNSGDAAVDSRGKKGPGGDAGNETLGGGGKAWSEGKASAGLIAGPAEPATVSSLGGKPEETRKGEEATGYEGSTTLGMSSAPGKLGKGDIASYRDSVRPNYRGNGRKGLDGRSTETAMTGVTNEAVEALPLPAVDSENKGKNGSNNQSIGKASVSPPGEAAEASPLQGVKSDNKGKKKKKRPSGGRQAGAAPSSDWLNGSRDKPLSAAEGNRGRRNGDGQGTVWEAKSEGLGGKQPEVERRVYSHRPTESSSNRRSDSDQGMTRKANEDFGEKQLVVEIKAQPHPAADSNNCRRSNGDQEMNQEAKSEGFEDKQTVVEMRATTQLKPCYVRNSRGRWYSGAHSRANGTARQHSSVWVPKAAAVPVRTEVGNIP